CMLHCSCVVLRKGERIAEMDNFREGEAFAIEVAVLHLLRWGKDATSNTESLPGPTAFLSPFGQRLILSIPFTPRRQGLLHFSFVCVLFQLFPLVVQLATFAHANFDLHFAL